MGTCPECCKAGPVGKTCCRATYEAVFVHEGDSQNNKRWIVNSEKLAEYLGKPIEKAMANWTFHWMRTPCYTMSRSQLMKMVRDKYEKQIWDEAFELGGNLKLH